MRIAIAGDHASPIHKKAIAERLRALGHQVTDHGTDSEASCDYADFARLACSAWRRGEADRVVLVCGTGIGMSIAANKVRGLRCALVHSLDTARLAAQHNQAQCLALGARIVDAPTAMAMVEAWLTTPFEQRHQRRLDKVAELETNPC